MNNLEIFSKDVFVIGENISTEVNYLEIFSKDVFVIGENISTDVNNLQIFSKDVFVIGENIFLSCYQWITIILHFQQLNFQILKL